MSNGLLKRAMDGCKMHCGTVMTIGFHFQDYKAQLDLSLLM